MEKVNQPMKTAAELEKEVITATAALTAAQRENDPDFLIKIAQGTVDRLVDELNRAKHREAEGQNQ